MENLSWIIIISALAGVIFYALYLRICREKRYNKEIREQLKIYHKKLNKKT